MLNRLPADWLQGLMLPDLLMGEEPIVFPHETAIGSMANYITTTNAKNFQPMNANFGLFPDLPEED